MWLYYNDRYEVSEEGLVRNKETNYILKPAFDVNGYPIVCINKRPVKVHRIVASRFLPAPTEENLEIDHIDRNRTNNYASNLRWVSHAVNVMNKGDYKNNTTGHKYIVRRNNTSYRVQIKFNKTLIFNSTYKTLPEAIEARDTQLLRFGRT